MSSTLVLQNRSGGTRVDCHRLRQVIRLLLEQELRLVAFELGVYLVGVEQITRLNESYLKHTGPTDVITFDYIEAGAPGIAGEIVICLPEAKIQAQQFNTTWQSELVRYIVHGILHLLGFDDQTVPERKRMKREEDRLMRYLNERFDLGKTVSKDRALNK